MGTIKIIDLLNKISRGEKVPEKIKYEGIIYEYSDNDKFYYTDGWSLYREFYLKGNCLNDEVEILEEKKIPEKLPLEAGSVNDKLFLIKYITHNRNKLNEIIDYLESKEKENENE